MIGLRDRNHVVHGFIAVIECSVKDRPAVCNRDASGADTSDRAPVLRAGGRAAVSQVDRRASHAEDLVAESVEVHAVESAQSAAERRRSR